MEAAPGRFRHPCHDCPVGVIPNDPVPNPNVTALEWLNRRPGFAGRVRAFATWRAFHAIFNEARSGIPVNAGLQPLGGGGADVALIDKLQADTPHPWSEDERFDAFTHAYAMRSLVVDQPRLLYVGYGEPDAHAHAGTYDEYLLAINRADRFLKELWDAAQADPAWVARTTMIVTTTAAERIVTARSIANTMLPDHRRGGLPYSALNRCGRPRPRPARHSGRSPRPSCRP